MSVAALQREIAQLKAKAETAVTGDLRARVVEGRSKQRPRRTREVLELLALEPGLVGQMARGDLRLKRLGTSRAAIDPEVELPQMMGELRADPLGFVMWAFDWGSDPSMRVVELPARWCKRYESEFGPDAWACELLDDIAGQVRGRAFEGKRAVDAVRVAVSSGHGIGKSAVTAWLALWVMSTRPNARGVVTASTGPQLESKTWAQIASWTKRCVTREWWSVSTGRGSMKMNAKAAPESWNCFAQTARAESAESFAGLHAADSSPFFLVDESSGVPDAIKEVMEGAMTDGEPFLIAFGNPTRNSGWFHAAFNGQRHRWTTRQIDSRDVAITNKQQIQQWVDDFGVESDFVKVRVRGIFPSASSLQFIATDLVEQAVAREPPTTYGETVVLGVDVARFGGDSSVIFTRVGRDARTWPIKRFEKVDTMVLVTHVAQHANLFRGAGHRVAIAVDGGGVGGGVVDRLRQLGFDVTEVSFGGKAYDPRKYANRRAEIWGLARDWLTGGALPQDNELLAELTAVEYAYNASDQIQLERKESMKARGIGSPDAADALAITFAVPTLLPMPQEHGSREQRERERVARLNYIDDAFARGPNARAEHDPYAHLS
jgi:hypothetical protein